MSLTPSRATELASGDYGKETIKHIASYVAPVFWGWRNADGSFELNNGSIFFVNAGHGIFAITACHVFDGYMQAKERSSSRDIIYRITPNTFGAPGRENIHLDLQKRLIDCDAETDIATFRVLPEEIDATGSTVLTAWPPTTPQKGLGIGFAGFPGQARKLFPPRAIEFGVYSALSIATEINDRLIACQIQREHIVDTPWCYPLPTRYDIGGLSGGPLLTHIEHNGIYYWGLGGVIREANDELEIIYASRADCLLPDGTISADNLRA